MEKKRSEKYVLLFGALLLPACFLFSLSFGAGSYTIFEMLRAALHGESAASNILMLVRLPRTLAALGAGAGLAAAGAVIQTTLDNPMAGPSIIGVNSGAGFAAVLFLALFPGNMTMLPFAAFLGALFAVLLISFAAQKTGASRTTLILSGVAVNALLGAASDAVTTFSPDTLTGISSFRVGSFASLSPKALFPALFLIAAALILALCLRNELEILSMGDETAYSLGLNASRARFFLLLSAAAMAGASVSVAGLLGFVGLIVPHALRLLLRGKRRLLLPASALFGGSFVLFADTLCRIVFSPYEFPVGVAMAFLGAPLFLYLLFRKRRPRP